MSNVSDKVNVIVDCKLDKKGVEDFQNKLKSYNLGKEFNYAVAIIEILIANGENNTNDTNEIVGIDIVPKVQYIVPFVSKEMAELYLKELSILNKLTMFLPINDEGKVVVKDYNVENTMNEMWDKETEIDKNLPTEKQLIILASRLKELNKEQLDNYLIKIIGLKDKEYIKSILKNIYSKYNI